MWDRESLSLLWLEVIGEFKKDHPEWSQALREKKYKPIVVNRKANWFGQCDNNKRTVSVNLHLHKHSERGNIVDTMLHEIAHAVDYSVNGRSSRHGQPWRDIAILLGCNSSATSKAAVKVEYKYVMCLHTEDSIRFVRGYNRKPSRTPIGKYIIGSWLTKDKEGTKDKLIVYPWNKWKSICHLAGKGYYQEDHRGEKA